MAVPAPDATALDAAALDATALDATALDATALEATALVVAPAELLVAALGATLEAAADAKAVVDAAEEMAAELPVAPPAAGAAVPDVPQFTSNRVAKSTNVLRLHMAERSGERDCTGHIRSNRNTHPPAPLKYGMAADTVGVIGHVTKQSRPGAVLV